jgi:hypothetical protein
VSVFLAAAVLGLLQAGFAQAQEPPTKCWAVICGVAKYETINNLTYTVDDANDLAAALKQYPEWQDPDPDQIQVLTDSAASKNGIHAAIQQMGAKAGPGDVCLFFFSGHGTQVADASGEEADRKDEAICPWDTTGSLGNVITDDELASWLVACLPDADVVAVFDTCFAGGMAKGLTVKSVRNPNLPPQATVRHHFGSGLAQRLAARGAKGRVTGSQDIGGANAVVLMACQEGGLSYETSSLQNGVFSYYLVEGLGKPAAGMPADDGDGLLAAEEEFDYASPRTTAYARNDLRVKQIPRLFDGNPNVETVIVESGAAPVPPIAAFAANPTSGPAPLTVTFTDHSTGSIETWAWDFGDGGTSTQQNPTHTYESRGTYTVVLTVTGPGGTDQATASVSVKGRPGK